MLEQPSAAGAPAHPALQARLEHARRATSQLQQLADRLTPVAERMTSRHAQMLVTVGDDVRTRGVFSHVTADMLVRDVFGIR